MLLELQPRSAAPIHEQIVGQIIFAVAAGGLEAGALIPSVRDLAQRLVVHPNTVAKAFQELERRGIVTARRGVGMEVTTGAPEQCRKERQEIVRGRIREALKAAAAASLAPDEIRKLIDDEFHHLNGAGRAREKRT